MRTKAYTGGTVRMLYRLTDNLTIRGDCSEGDWIIQSDDLTFTSIMSHERFVGLVHALQSEILSKRISIKNESGDGIKTPSPTIGET